MTATLLVIRLVILFSLPHEFHCQCIGANNNDNHMIVNTLNYYMYLVMSKAKKLYKVK